MADSPYYGTSNQYVQWCFSVFENSYSIPNNTSNVTVEVWARRTNTGYSSYGTGSGSLTVDGTTYGFPITSSMTLTSSWRRLCYWSGDVAHNPDGSKTLAVSGSWNISSIGLTAGSQSWTYGLTTIPRASNFTVTPSVNAGSAVAVAISRASSAFTHKVTVSFGSKTYTASGVAENLSYTIPLGWLTEIPSATAGSATVSVETYNGATKIGSTVSKTFTITAPASAVPSAGTVTIAQKYDVLSPAVPSTWNRFVQGRSGAVVSVSGAAGYQGSTIAAVRVSGGGYSANAASLTTGVLASAGTNTFTVTVTDSRGRTASATASITVDAYAPPQITAALTQRANSAGSLDSSGSYALGTADFAYSSLGGSNSVVRALSFRESGSTTWSSPISFNSGSAVLFGGSFDTTRSYDIRYLVTDFFGSVVLQDVLSVANPIFEVGNGGLTLSVGKEPGDFIGFEVDWPAKFNKGVDIADKAAFRNSLGLGSTAGALPIANGGTEATTVAAARNNLGLGNTAGAVPIANGGTQATTAAAALANLGAAAKVATPQSVGCGLLTSVTGLTAGYTDVAMFTDVIRDLVSKQQVTVPWLVKDSTSVLRITQAGLYFIALSFYGDAGSVARVRLLNSSSASTGWVYYASIANASTSVSSGASIIPIATAPAFMIINTNSTSMSVNATEMQCRLEVTKLV